MTDPAASEWWNHLPVVNATLNSASAVLLVGAFVMIKQRRVTAHATLMISAFVISTAFLACYVIYHVMKGRHLTLFPQGSWRPLYLGVLYTHLIGAMLILPLIFSSFWFAWKQQWKRHRQISSITFPVWLYVSVTGVVVYLMLYQLAPTLKH